MHGFNGMGYGMNWGMGFGWIIGIAILALVVWAVVKLVNNNNANHYATDNKQKTALQILKERFTKGEIDKQEFEDKKRLSKNLAVIADVENQFHPTPKGSLIFNNFPLGILG